MKPVKPIAILFLLFITLSLSAQRVHYKGNYYTLVNSKIFHLGHNVYGKLTIGERDTLYMIARELYNDKGKMKPKYRERRKRDRYKLPDGFWDQKIDTVVKKEPTSIAIVSNNNSVEKSKVAKTQDIRKENEPEERKLVETKEEDQKKYKSSKDRDDKEDESAKKKEQEHIERREENLAKEQKKENDEEEKARRKEEKKQRDQEREQRKEEKEQNRKEKVLKEKEKSIKNHKEAKKKLKKTEEKYLKLKEKGELSPNAEAEWLEKIQRLKEKLAKAEKNVD